MIPRRVGYGRAKISSRNGRRGSAPVVASSLRRSVPAQQPPYVEHQPIERTRLRQDCIRRRLRASRIRRDGVRVLHRAFSARVLADPEPRRARRAVVLHLPVSFGERSGAVQPGSPDLARADGPDVTGPIAVPEPSVAFSTRSRTCFESKCVVAMSRAAWQWRS